MKIGDYLIYAFDNSLWICHEKDKAHMIVDNSGVVTAFDPKGFNVMNITGPMLWIANPTFLEVSSIMKGRFMPHWVIATQLGQGLAHSTPKANWTAAGAKTNGGAITTPQGYPIGTIIEGKGTAVNFWIVNKQNSRDISLLWDGKGKRFCGSELEKQDVIAPNSVPKVISCGMMIHHLKLGLTPIPKWAKTLYMTQPQAIVAPKPTINHINPMLDKWSKAFAKEDEPMKPIATFQDVCQHEYKSYMGLTECYDWCTKCDAKRMVKK